MACGPGLVAGKVNDVSHTTCKITGIDVNEAMLNAARRTLPAIDWHLGSASDLPFDDSSFDVVFCQQGLQYFPDRAKGMREMHRVLAPGGRLAANVWGPLERQPFDVIYREGLSAFFGPEALNPSTLGMSLNTYSELHNLAKDAGFTGVRIRFENRTARYPDVRTFLVGWTRASPNAAQFQGLSDEMRDRFVTYLIERLDSFTDDAGLVIPRENHFLIASR